MKIVPVIILAALSLVAKAADKPNFIIIFTDDQGYGDLGCFGSTKIKTPHIDRLAKEGRRFTNFMVASPVCTPSRAALLTGCYPKRIGMHQHVLFPSSTKGLNPTEHTIADHLKGQGYATACFGKWHLGHHPETLPQSNGFDTYFGIPYSNDMNHPDNKGKPKGGWAGMDALWKDPESTLTKWKTPLMENEKDRRASGGPADGDSALYRQVDRVHQDECRRPISPSLSTCHTRCPTSLLYVPDDVRDADPLNAYTNVIEHIDCGGGSDCRASARVEAVGEYLPHLHDR